MINKYQVLVLTFLLIAGTSISSHHPHNNSPTSPNSEGSLKAQSEIKGTGGQTSNGVATTQVTTNSAVIPQKIFSSSRQSTPARQGHSKKFTSTSTSSQQTTNNQGSNYQSEAVTTTDLASNNLLNPQRIHSFSTFLIAYGIIIMVMLIGAKYAYFPKSTIIEAFFDLAIMMEGAIKNYNKKGYQSPSQPKEAVDDSHSITVGYAAEHGRNLFWQRNSVEGI